ncbi:MAG: hypothetical protein ACREAF_02105 [Nitrosopumilaceae archaeon]
MPQIRICPNCKKPLQTGEVHSCPRTIPSEFVICSKCGHRYRVGRGHICPTMIK